MNSVILVGRLTKDVDLKYTSTGTAVGTFTVAVDRPFKNSLGEKETDFINCTIWRKPAETFATYVRKGHQVSVQGRWQTRNYENNQGQRVYVNELVVENFTLLNNQKTADSGSYGNGNTNTYGQQQNANTGQNFNDKGYNQTNDPFMSSGTPIHIEDDDLPF